jgi:glutamate/aspartate transport system permease protein
MSDFTFDVKVVDQYAPFLWQGLQFSVKLTIFAMIGGIVLGTLLALARLSSNKVLSGFAIAYINFVRSVPLLMVVFWFFIGMPWIFAWGLNFLGDLGLKMSAWGWISNPETLAMLDVWKNTSTVEVGPLKAAFITFTLFEAAYYAEIMRAGIQSISKGQVGAAQALGLSYSQVMRLVILPQAFRNMLPVLLTQTIVLFQDVSLVSLLGVKDFVGAASTIAQNENVPNEMYITIGVVYFVLCLSLSSVVKILQKRIAIVR